VTVNGVSDKRGGDDLVSSCSNSHADDRSDVVSRDVFELYAEDDEADHDKSVTDIRQPESVFWCRLPSNLLVAVTHEPVGKSTTELLTKYCANDDADKLKTDCLWIKVELWKEQLWNFDGEKDTAESENDRIGDGGNDDRGVLEKCKGLKKFLEGERCWVDAAELHVFLSEGRATMLNTTSDVASLGSEENVQKELDKVD